jgi:hypothetical protein
MLTELTADERAALVRAVEEPYWDVDQDIPAAKRALAKLGLVPQAVPMCCSGMYETPRWHLPACALGIKLDRVLQDWQIETGRA